MVITMECWYQIPWYFNLRRSRFCSKLPCYFYNTDQKYQCFNPRKRRYHGKLPKYFYNIGPRLPSCETFKGSTRVGSLIFSNIGWECFPGSKRLPELESKKIILINVCSRSGRYLFFLHRRPVFGPMRVQLLHPVSRFKQVQSLQHLCRYGVAANLAQ